MNRRELFAGAGAAALASVLPDVLVDPCYDDWFQDMDEVFEGLKPQFNADMLAGTSVWLVQWGDGREETWYGDLRDAVGVKRVVILNP